MEKMKAAIFEGMGNLTVKTVEKPRIEETDDLILKILACGICGTDIHILENPPSHPAINGTILGHEFVGEVVDIGSEVKNVKKGDHVIVNPHPSCGKCVSCKRGRPELCENLYLPKGHEFQGLMKCLGITGNGGFSEYSLVKNHAAYKINKNVKVEIAALAEPLALIIHTLKKINVNLGDSVAVLGAGPIGMLFVLTLKACGASTIIVSDPSSLSQQMALDCGANYAVNPLDENLTDFVMNKTDNKGVNLVIEAMGSLLGDCIPIVKESGTIIQFGHNELAHPEISVGEIVKKEIEIKGSYGTLIGQYDFDDVVKIMENNIIDLEKIITEVIPLEKILNGIESIKNRKAIKIIVKPNI